MKLNLKTFLKESVVDLDKVQELQHVVIAPGRFNPPHSGHKFMVEKLLMLGDELNAVPKILIIDSGKRDDKNPLTGEERQYYLNVMFPYVECIIAQNAYDAIIKLYELGCVPIGGVVGQDRADSYKQLIGRVFSEDQKEQYKDVVLDRDPEVDDVIGISATKVREAVKEDDKVKFRVMVDLDTDHANELFNLLHKRLVGEDNTG